MSREVFSERDATSGLRGCRSGARWLNAPWSCWSLGILRGKGSSREDWPTRPAAGVALLRIITVHGLRKCDAMQMSACGGGGACTNDTVQARAYVTDDNCVLVRARGLEGEAMPHATAVDLGGGVRVCMCMTIVLKCVCVCDNGCGFGVGCVPMVVGSVCVYVAVVVECVCETMVVKCVCVCICDWLWIGCGCVCDTMVVDCVCQCLWVGYV